MMVSPPLFQQYPGSSQSSKNWQQPGIKQSLLDLSAFAQRHIGLIRLTMGLIGGAFMAASYFVDQEQIKFELEREKEVTKKDLEATNLKPSTELEKAKKDLEATNAILEANIQKTKAEYEAKLSQAILDLAFHANLEKYRDRIPPLKTNGKPPDSA